MTFRTAIKATIIIAIFIVVIGLLRIAIQGSLALGMHEEGEYHPVCEAVYEAKHLDDFAAETGRLWQTSMQESPDPILQDTLLTNFQYAVSDALAYYVAAVATPLDDTHAVYLYYRLMEFSTADDGLVGMREGYDVNGLFLAANYYQMRADLLYSTLDCKDLSVQSSGQTDG